MSGQIDRHFVTLGGRWGPRQVHYRRAGSGPLLLMLHQSPQSSRELEPLMDQWSEYFTIVAPDSPGYGLSDPLGVEQAELSEFADATIEFLDAIGARRFGVYGFHTGGMIGVAIAARYRDRVTAFACNGIAVPSDEELREILAAYLPPFEPRWDGSHLAWLWSRLREQTIFFPWHNRTLAGRMDFPMPSPEHQQKGLLEFLRAGEHYHVAYRAAFVFRAAQVVPGLRVPGLLTAASLDPLQAHLARLTDVPGTVQVIESETPAAALEHCWQQLKAHPGESLAEPPATEPVAGRLWNQILETPTAAVRVQRGGAGAGVPVLLVHGAGASSAALADIARGIAESRHVIAVDLRGHGETGGDWTADTVTPQSCAEFVRGVVEALHAPAVDVVGIDGGTAVAAQLAIDAPEQICRVALVHTPVLDAEQIGEWRSAGMPSMQPDWFGGHLQRCWHMVRDSRLYFPWFLRDQASIRWQKPDLDEQRIQREMTEYLKAEGAWQAMLNAQLDYPWLERLGQCTQQVMLCASADNAWYEITGQVAARTDLPVRELPGGHRDWGAFLARALSA